MMPIWITTPLPIPKCPEALKFAANLEMVADLKFEKHFTNSQIAEKLQIWPCSIPRLINLYLYESETKKKKSFDWLQKSFWTHQIWVGLVREALEHL